MKKELYLVLKSSEKAVAGIMTKLDSYHETDNNTFEVIPV